MRREAFKFWDLVRLIVEILRYLKYFQHKIHVYWPQEKSQPVKHGPFTVSLQSVRHKPCWVERILNITHGQVWGKTTCLERPPKLIIAIQVWNMLFMVSIMHKGSKKLASFGTDLTHWGLVMHICNSKLTIIGSDNGLSPGQCQAIIWSNARILLIGPLGTHSMKFSFKKMQLNMSSAKKWWPSCVGLNVLKTNTMLQPVSYRSWSHTGIIVC